MSISGSSFDSFNRHLLIGCRPRKHMQASHLSDASTVDTVREPVARDWLWKPWYAKLWWAAIPVYWAGAAASLKLTALAEFYTSALAGYLNMLFFPLTKIGRASCRERVCSTCSSRWLPNNEKKKKK